MSIELQAMARQLLERANDHQWSLQGMGMLRLHLPGDCRLHIWDKRYRVPGVSMIHDHLQWGLKSTIISGSLLNRKYVETPDGDPYLYATIKPGYGTHFKHEPRPISLSQLGLYQQIHYPGDSYQQAPSEIHETEAEDGTVTIMRKTPTRDESARVFWPVGSEWGSAEPRAASAMVVAAIVANALARWTGV